MIVWPSIDVKGGRVVQLEGGDPSKERVSLRDPLEVAARFRKLGFTRLHIVDLDAALGGRSQIDWVLDWLSQAGLQAQVGGGVRERESIECLLEAGVSRVLIGTRAIEDPGWLEEMASHYPGRLVVAADTRDGRVLIRGWRDASTLGVEEWLSRGNDLDLAAVLITDVSREGRMVGVDREAYSKWVDASRHPIMAAGGVASMGDIEALAGASVAECALGMALYRGELDAEEVAQRYGGVSA